MHNGSVSWCRPLLRRVLQGSVPRLPSSYCGTPTSSLPREDAARFAGPTGSPRFLDNPCARAVLSDPGGSLAPTLQATSCFARFVLSDIAFHVDNRVGLHNSSISGLYHTAHAPAVYASQPGSPLDHARLASGLGLWPVGTFTHGLLRLVSAFASSSPRLAWRNVHNSTPPVRPPFRIKSV